MVDPEVADTGEGLYIWQVAVNVLNKQWVSCWNEEELPEQWKESVIIPIYKKDDKTGCSNYQDLSLLSATYRIL
jgi:hypothetical protein